MRRPDFERCTSEATRLLYKQDVSNRILNIKNLTYDKNIIFDSIQNYSLITRTPLFYFLSEDKQALLDGCTIYDRRHDQYIVLYNDDVRYFEHLNWTLGHEIGHIYLGHTEDGDIEEVEAHYFASQLFMPDFSLKMIMKEYGKINTWDVAEIFGVSESAAKKRIETMNKRTCVTFSSKAKEIWESQKERIDMYYDCQKEGYDYRNTLSFWLDMKADYIKQMRAEMYL